MMLHSEPLLNARFERSASLPSHLSNSNAIVRRQRFSTSETKNTSKRSKRSKLSSTFAAAAATAGLRSAALEPVRLREDWVRLELTGLEKRVNIRHGGSAELATLRLAIGAERLGPADGQASHPRSEDPVRFDGATGSSSFGVWL
ncbi:MAG: hypothetical protein Q9217_001086 [Psora testacea]